MAPPLLRLFGCNHLIRSQSLLRSERCLLYDYQIKHDWQDGDYVLGLFGKTVVGARRAYAAFIAKGVVLGRRLELGGGDLIRL